tara:strand:+ start:489 stop:1082 length:594 start_codon:yes stop_codon:yes gene_type:complete
LIALIYIHGFLSSPQSYKAQQVGALLGAQRPDISYHCPHLTPYPAEVQRQLETLVESLLPQPVYLLGSSLGGYWCTYLAEKYDLPAVLINPSVRPYEMMLDYLEQPLKSYYSDQVYTLSAVHVDEIKAVDTPLITRPENYWLMAQTADETLDYRQAVEKYSACKQWVEEGGDHSFQNFERHIPSILEFLEHNKNRDV